jgi:hypothetical protein
MEMSRRSFLQKGLQAGIILSGVGPLLSSCSGVQRPSGKSSNIPMDQIPELDDQSVAILYYASMAPSKHNTQPWFVKKIDRFGWVIGADPERRLPAVDPQNRELLLAIGAFIENLSVAAEAFGYTVQVQVLASNPADEEILKVVLKKEKAVNYPLTRITSRRTIREGLKSVEIKNADIQKITKSLWGGFFYFPPGSEHGKCLADWAIESFRDQTNRDDAQKELAKWIRFNKKEFGTHRDGLILKNLEVTGYSSWYVREFMGRKDVVKKQFRQRGIERVAKMARQGGGWMIVTSRGEKVGDLIEAGRNFEKLFLLAGDYKIAIHPMTQMLEEEKWRNEVGKLHGTKMIPQFVLRVGYIDKYPEPTTLRRPVSWFVKV